MTVDVIMKDGAIKNILVDDRESPGAGKKAIAIQKKQILENQTVNLDAVTGATITSSSFVSAVSANLKKSGVDLKKFAPSPQMRQEMRRRLGIADDEVAFGHVGRFSYQKNHIFLISVLRRAVERGAKVKLVAVGSGETMEEVKAACRASGLEERVIFVGNTANVCDYYSAMDVFLLPSRFEGLPIVGVEAQASGLPCIFSAAVTREVALSPNVTFLPIGDGDEDRWAEEAVRLGALPRGDNSSSLRAAGFDIDDTVRAIVALYRTGVIRTRP